MSWKPEVKVSGEWSGNQLRFATKKEGETRARQVMWSWLQVDDARAMESDDPVNYAMVDGKLVPVEAVA
jgi:hypothetical protein